MKAVIMAGGEGTRLRPLTSNTPKPMLPMANRPMMEHVIALLARHGFDDIVVTVAFLANQIRSYFGDGSELGVRMRYATEEVPLGTAGSVRNAAAELTDTFLVISGDVLTDVDLTVALRAHEKAGALATIGLQRSEVPLDFGIVITAEDGSIERFLEKPTWGQVFSDTINTGIYVLEPEIFELIPEGIAVDFASEVFPAALEQGAKVMGTELEGYWEDVGTPAAYLRAHQDVLDERVRVDVPGFMIDEGVWLGEGADVDPEAAIDGPVVIGDNCRVEAGAHLRAYTVLGSDVVVKGDAFLERTVVHDHTYVGPGVRLRGAVVGRAVDLRRGASVEEGAILGDECFIGERAVVSQNVKIYPFKSVDSAAVVNSSIVWESRGARTLFGKRGVRGLANVDITADLAVRLAMAYGTSLKKGSVVTVSRDTSRAARALKRAIIAGLNLTGVHVDDLELATVPLTRFQVRSQRAQGGVTVRLAADDPASVEIRLIDSDGADVGEAGQRKLDRLLSREDFRRAFAGDIGDIVFPPRALEFYTAALERCVDVDGVRDARFKVVLDYSFGSTSLIMPNVLAKLGMEVLSVNPYAATVVDADRAELPARASRVGDLVRASGSHLGLVLDPDGETAVVIDDGGRVLTHDQALLAFVDLTAVPGSKIALPVAASMHARAIVERRGAEVEWTKLSAAHLMEVCGNPDVTFGASQEGGYIWPRFLPAYDAVATLVHLAELLVRRGGRLSEVTRDLPHVHIAHEVAPTPWEAKGAVMRHTVEQAKDREVQLVDGVKVFHERSWALVLPDPDEPFTHVWAEAETEQAAQQLAQEYARRIRRSAREGQFR